MNFASIPAQRHWLAASCMVLAAGAGHAAGLDIHADADAADVGLPAYPGATKKPEKGSDAAGFKFGIWGASFGVKLAVVSYASDDDVDKVAAFYRDAMAKVGPVLDCSRNVKKADAPSRSADEQRAAKDRPVTCDNDTVEAGGRLFKVGIGRDQRVFKATPAQGGTRFQLVHVEEHGTD